MNSRVESQEVNWWAVHEYVEKLSNALDSSWPPLLGTPAWCQLDDEDPAKLASLLDASQHFALRLETSQAALRQASKALATEHDWSAVSQEIRGLQEFRAARPWMKREAS